MQSLAHRLVARAGCELDGDALDTIDGLLAAAIATARARCPELVDVAGLDDAFVEAIAARTEADATLVDALTRLVLPDLYLVVACLRGEPAAIAVVERVVRDEVTRALARLGGSLIADDVAQELLLKLMVADGRSARLEAFGGHGTLQAWLRVAAVRTAISLARKRHDVAIADDSLAAVAADIDDQGLAFIKSSYRAEFKLAFAAALAELVPRSRTLLRLQIIDQLTLEEIGAFYRVSRTTTTRWLADARRALVAATEAQLVARLQLAPAEVAELTRLAASNLYSTLPSLLRID